VGVDGVEAARVRLPRETPIKMPRATRISAAVAGFSVIVMALLLRGVPAIIPRRKSRSPDGSGFANAMQAAARTGPDLLLPNGVSDEGPGVRWLYKLKHCGLPE
jgi:hypothetical protein